MARNTKPDLGIPEFITIDAAMARSGFGRSFIYEKIAGGDIEARKIGKAIRVVRVSLDGWLEAAPRAVIRPTARQMKRAADAAAAKAPALDRGAN